MNFSKTALYAFTMAVVFVFSVNAHANSFEKIKEMGLGAKSIVEMPIDGMVAYVAENGKVFFMSSDGRYVFSGGSVTDVWNGTPLETGGDIQRSARTIPLESMEIDFDKLDALSIGTGSKTVHVITDPTCPACRKLTDLIPEYGDEYTFKILALPALGKRSEEITKRLACQSDRELAAQALLDGTADQLPAPKNCNLDAYKQALLVADYIRVREVPFLIGPNNVVSRGLPNNLQSWLEESSTFLSDMSVQDGTGAGQAPVGPVSSDSLNQRLREALN